MDGIPGRGEKQGVVSANRTLSPTELREGREEASIHGGLRYAFGCLQ